MLLDQLSVDIGNVGTGKIIQEGLTEDRDNQGVFAADSWVADLYSIVRFTSEEYTLLAQWIFSLNYAI